MALLYESDPSPGEIVVNRCQKFIHLLIVFLLHSLALFRIGFGIFYLVILWSTKFGPSNYSTGLSKQFITVMLSLVVFELLSGFLGLMAVYMNRIKHLFHWLAFSLLHVLLLFLWYFLPFSMIKLTTFIWDIVQISLILIFSLYIVFVRYNLHRRAKHYMDIRFINLTNKFTVPFETSCKFYTVPDDMMVCPCIVLDNGTNEKVSSPHSERRINFQCWYKGFCSLLLMAVIYFSASFLTVDVVNFITFLQALYGGSRTIELLDMCFLLLMKLCLHLITINAGLFGLLGSITFNLNFIKLSAACVTIRSMILIGYDYTSVMTILYSILIAIVFVTFSAQTCMYRVVRFKYFDNFFYECKYRLMNTEFMKSCQNDRIEIIVKTMFHYFMNHKYLDSFKISFALSIETHRRYSDNSGNIDKNTKNTPTLDRYDAIYKKIFEDTEKQENWTKIIMTLEDYKSLCQERGETLSNFRSSLTSPPSVSCKLKKNDDIEMSEKCVINMPKNTNP